MSPLTVTDPPHLIFGCGYLGRRVAALWRGDGHRVAALTRRNADALRAAGLEPITGDVLDPTSLTSLPPADTVLYAVGLDRAAGKSMREVYVTGLANVLAARVSATCFIYISSTSVYSQTGGEWITETAPTEPVDESGRVVLEAEQLLRATRPTAIVLRFAGIYGPNRLLRKEALLKGEPLVGDADKWLNLVHVADGAAAVLCAESHGAPGETYNVADGAPVAGREFYTLLAQLLGAPEARFTERPEPGAPNRCIDSTKARTTLGWVPRFAGYREGLTAAVAESTM
jgi:nucleoside-diphosphate-sugar epimerase